MNDGSAKLDGWQKIAEAAGRSQDAVQRAALRSFDPMPVWYDAWGGPFTTTAALEAWVKRNTLPAPIYQALRKRPHGAGPAGSARPDRRRR